MGAPRPQCFPVPAVKPPFPACVACAQVRVGAHVHSSSARHSSFSVNYWCVECMCAKPAVRRAARLLPGELQKVLPGAELLSAIDVQRVCTLLGIPLPSAEARGTMAAGRRRATRSGRKFGSWGGDDAPKGTDAAADTEDAARPAASKRARRAR